MYICICSALREDQVREAINNGAKTTDEVFSYWNTRENCGLCTFQMQHMLANAAADKKTT